MRTLVILTTMIVAKGLLPLNHIDEHTHAWRLDKPKDLHNGTLNAVAHGRQRNKKGPPIWQTNE